MEGLIVQKWIVSSPGREKRLREARAAGRPIFTAAWPWPAGAEEADILAALDAIDANRRGETKADGEQLRLI